MTILMNKVQNKHYSLLLQDDTDVNEHILRIRSEKITLSPHDDGDDEEEDDDDDGFKSMIGEDEDEQDMDNDPDEDVDEVECSDEEIFSSNQHRALTNDGMRHGGAPSFGRSNDYHLLSNSEGEKIVGIGVDASLATIWTPTPMSPVRRAFFLASIMFGVLVVAMFLWALPCDVQPCDTELHPKPAHWFTQIDNIGVNYTQLLEKINGQLSLFASFYKMEDFIATPPNGFAGDSSKLNITPSGCGVMSFDESTGKENWKLDLVECPLHIKCDLLDATGDGISDCLLLGHTSMVLMFEPIYGTVFWHLHRHKREPDPVLEFIPEGFRYGVPLVIQDVNSDGFLELLFPGTPSIGGMGSAHLLLASGRSGAVLGRPYQIPRCAQVVTLFREDSSICYTCITNDHSDIPGPTGTIPLDTLLNDVGSEVTGDLLRNDTLELFTVPATPETNDAVCQIRHTREGFCPRCRVRIEFGLTPDSPLNQEYDDAAVVAWKVLSLNNVCKGVVFKLWRWDQTSLEDPFRVIPSAPSPSSGNVKRRESSGNPLFPLPPNTLDFKMDKLSSQHRAYKDGLESPSFAKGDSLTSEWFAPNRDGAVGSTHGATTYNHRQWLDVLRGQGIGRAAKSKRFYEHPTIHSHTGQQTSSNHGSMVTNPPVSTATANAADSSLPVMSTVLTPPGSRLQKLEEVLILLTFNGSEWSTRELGSMVVYQLCQVECIPSHLSQNDSVLVDMNELGSGGLSAFVSSSSFSSVRETTDNITLVTWSLESYIRKLITPVRAGV